MSGARPRASRRPAGATPRPARFPGSRAPAKEGISGEFENTKRNGLIIVVVIRKGKRKGDFQNGLYRGKK